uniref:ATP synthase peripheral stalk subunit F6, mitochondrial n=1 Tax=Gasterosteus aculeatus aculeatus TaxID=481459 RepID=A0AAQ4RPK4_GASAC
MCCITVVDPCPCCWELLRESSPAKKNNIKAVLLESTDCLHRKMAAALLRTGRLGSVKCLLAESWITLSRTPAAVTLSTKSGGSKKSSKKNSSGQMDPIQKLFLDSIREYSTKSQAAGGLVDAGSDYEKALAEEVAKLQRLYGGGDLASFPQFTFTETAWFSRCSHWTTQSMSTVKAGPNKDAAHQMRCGVNIFTTPTRTFSEGRHCFYVDSTEKIS